MPLKHPKRKFPVSKVDILGVKVDDLTRNEAINRILNLAKDSQKGHLVVTVNSEFIMLARRNRHFFRILRDADLALADGAGVVISKLIFGGKEHQRITGVDLIEELCGKANNRSIRIGFLGGFEDIADVVAKRQKEKNPDLKVVFAYPGESTMSFDSRLKKLISAAGRIDILFVAFGMGRQEFWIKRFINRVDVGVFIGVGGAFDYLSSVKIRAPRLLRRFALEWFWRLLSEPTRLWRMRVLPVFTFLVFKKRFFDFIKRGLPTNLA